MSEEKEELGEPLLCAHCFLDEGLKRTAAAVTSPELRCPNCGTTSKHLLRRPELLWLADMFFVRGSMLAVDFGGAPAIQFNEMQTGSLDPDPNLTKDVELIQKAAGIGLFHYGPRLWMLGHIEPLQRLLDPKHRGFEIARMLDLFPKVELAPGDIFFRVRKQPERPGDPLQYDSPPEGSYGKGRLDAPGYPIFYGSQDLDICVHESRFIAGDELYAASLSARRPLRLLDLSAILKEEGTEFESLDLAVLMLFLGSSKSYETTRAIARATRDRGFDGMIYPSYFSVLRTGSVPFETVYGLSLRRLDSAHSYERSKIIENIALFGRPVANKVVDVAGINRLVIRKVSYDLGFGPVVF
ncbi:RES family NAD+ phosphorylase [Sphingomonas lutea]|uniref:RES family NAD+ phosphorylase n=1 Tax=Sphingomonas lutea TaxID=1045317 RepID=A0A7G9SF30_9SPHN|nr:RES family NAD+ phosphorylase [Sphingomonas lutea]QNN66455.1 RES family NAD+ phosphorylase [Sphingomonas lutea]